MSPALVRRACAATLIGLLTAPLVAGCSTASKAALAGTVTVPAARSFHISGDLRSSAGNPRIYENERALAVSRSISCAGDSTSSPARSRVVAYSSLAGSTFAAREKKADGRVMKVGPARISLKDFKVDGATYDGGVLGRSSAGLQGAGMSKTTVRIVPDSSTRASKVPHTFPKTNQLDVLKVIAPATVLRGFTVRGTAQGHLYNGIRVEKVQRLRADHVRVIGVPGDDHQPPGETFAINDYRTKGSRWSHIRIDGRGVGATGFGINSSTDIRICDAVSKNNPTGMGFAFWQSSGITCVDCRAYDNGFSGFNFERTSGRVTLIRPSATGNRYDMRIASDRTSAKFRIVDPVLRHGVWTIWMPRTWYVKNRQKRSDVTLIVHGRQRNDLLRFRTY